MRKSVLRTLKSTKLQELCYLEEGVNAVFGMEACEHSSAVKLVDDKGPENVPAPQLVDDLDERLVMVRLDVVQRHAGRVKVVHLPFDRVDQVGLVAGGSNQPGLDLSGFEICLLEDAPP